jgi:hypothetical protein
MWGLFLFDSDHIRGAFDDDSKGFVFSAKDQIVSFQFEHRTPEMVIIRGDIGMLELDSQRLLFGYVNWKCLKLPYLCRVEHAFRRVDCLYSVFRHRSC